MNSNNNLARSRVSESLSMARSVLLVASMALLLSGCFNRRGGDIPYAPAGFDRPGEQEVALPVADYKLQPLDTVDVSIFSVPELSGERQVDLTGAVIMPLIGDVPARGLTARQLANELKFRYGARYLEKPDILVSLKDQSVLNFTVQGAVNNPAGYPYRPGIKLLDAVALAGGTSKNANLRRVVIFRKIDGVQQAAAFDLKDVMDNKMENPAIAMGDTVIVDGSALRETFRDILQTLPVVALFSRF